MKNAARMIVAQCLAVLARGIVRRYKPKVIMVTGSVGKTSTKDAIAAVLSQRFYIRASEKSYNSEFGVPLTIIGVKNPWSSVLSWLRVFQEAFELLLLPNHYPKILVLEVGADHPGDLTRILRIATPDAVVVTRLPEVPVHVEAYASPEAVREEEFAPAFALAAGAPLIISADDSYAREYAKRVSASLTTFGFSENADIELQDVNVYEETGVALGMQATLVSAKGRYSFVVRGVLGRPQLLAPAAAYALGSVLMMEPDDILNGIEAYEPPAGRAHIIPGKNGSMLIDDTYNASPAAVEEALIALKQYPARRRVAVLGDMLELGRYSVQEHERIGALAAHYVDVLVTVGVRAKKLADAAETEGLAFECIYSFDDSNAAADALLHMVGEGDAVLIKGSQSIRTERIVEALLRDDADRRLLVRQDAEWKKR